MEPVRTSRHPRVAEAIRLHRGRRRTETGRTLLEGPHLIDEAARAGVILETVFVSENHNTPLVGRTRAGELVVVTEDVMKRLAGTQHPRGPVAVIKIPPDDLPDDRSLMVSWGVGDPGNVGTLIRSAAAFGLGFMAGPGTADPWSPKVLRSGAGSHFRTTIERAPTLSVATLQSRGFAVAASVVEGGLPPESLAKEPRCAVLVGDEASGLPEEAVDEADILITIPMPGETESLNAAVAGSLLAYQLAIGNP